MGGPDRRRTCVGTSKRRRGAPRGAVIFLMMRPCSEAGSPHAPAYIDGGRSPRATGKPSPFWDRRPTLSWRLLHRWPRDLHVRRRHVCIRDLHSLECGAAGGRAAVPSPRRRVPGRPGHLRGRRGRALDPAAARPEDVLDAASSRVASRRPATPRPLSHGLVLSGNLWLPAGSRHNQ
jgi:hypothetical protein